MNALKLFLSASVGVALAFSLPVQAKITTNKITTNKITTNKYAIAGQPSRTVPGEGAFSTVNAIVLSDGRRLSR